MEALLERETELPPLLEAIRSIAAGDGRLVVVTGDAGLGKTRLVREAAAIGETEGLRVLEARGTELELDYAYGIVRQLLERAVGGAAPEERARLLAGSAAAAAAAVDPEAEVEADDDPDADRSFARMRALHLLCARLADEHPTLLLVDDAHWADPASLRFLAFAARRLGGLPLGIVVASRPAADALRQPLLEGLLEETGALHVRPRALTPSAVARLMSDEAMTTVDPAFAAACHEVTRGNPFLLDQLRRELRDAGVAATADGARAVRSLGPEAIARTVLGRLRRTDATTVEVARWLAVLGDGAGFEPVARMSGLPADGARETIDRLYRAGVVEADAAQRLRFVHPIVRTAIYGDIPPAERAQRHARAAATMAERGEPAERVAAHLLAGEPAGDPGAVATLRAAAEQALTRGAPEGAATYLRRALAEPPPAAERPSLLRQLAHAEARAGDPGSVDRLQAAYASSDDVAFRVDTAIELSSTLMAADRYDAVAPMILALADELDDEHPGLRLRLEAALVTALRFEPSFADVVARRRPRIDALLADERLRDEPARQSLLAGLAFDGALRAQPPATVIDLAEQALAGQRLPWDMSRDMGFAIAEFALTLNDALESADHHASWAFERCRVAGSAAGLAWLGFFRAFTRLRQGRLADAEADAMLAANTAEIAGLRGWTGVALAYLVETRLERGDEEGLQEAYTRLLAAERRIDVPILSGCTLRGEGLMLLHLGQAEQALAAFEAIARVLDGWEAPNSVGWTEWRSGAVAALRALGRLDEAQALAAEELAQARELGLPRGLSRALRSSASVAPREAREALLAEAHAAAREGPSALERAWATYELGAHRRRNAEPAAARELLAEALDLAERCGAGRLAGLAREELVAAGARPRRASSTGRDALTPSEERV
ncbi:MAG TPA: AAA family ATPase, partial [Capillimicrobium sp.]